MLGMWKFEKKAGGEMAYWAPLALVGLTLGGGYTNELLDMSVFLIPSFSWLWDTKKTQDSFISVVLILCPS